MKSRLHTIIALPGTNYFAFGSNGQILVDKTTGRIIATRYSTDEYSTIKLMPDGITIVSYDFYHLYFRRLAKKWVTSSRTVKH